MMTLSTNGLWCVRRHDRTIILGRVTAADRTAALVARGHSAALAPAIAAGELATRMGAVTLARRAGLIEQVDGTNARAAGLLQ
jgi:hypothetical protein